MPKRTDISSVLIIGAGTIVFGQARELDYGRPACKTLREEECSVAIEADRSAFPGIDQ